MSQKGWEKVEHVVSPILRNQGAKSTHISYLEVSLVVCLTQEKIFPDQTGVRDKFRGRVGSLPTSHVICCNGAPTTHEWSRCETSRLDPAHSLTEEAIVPSAPRVTY